MNLKKFSVSRIGKTLFKNFDWEPDMAICAAYAFKSGKLMGASLNYYLAKFEKTTIIKDMTKEDSKQILRNYTKIRGGRNV